ncbi:type I restriction enzyme, S subunit [Cnuella takakiae]|uniref:Type I restriction enzyme, S subunit n=1 Tax=Cnuella takakiae TaxID=1302690 RepID=A0A1M4TMK7_9BACT|nr:restriction endonuclease subunit S [Cnuella takakiae]OLY90768.1 hypothetical protein BUE76_01775 [Cnuella takakiae]SHE45700.1 type I restriction enzyme, S subunit [Cnuella takakiae]
MIEEQTLNKTEIEWEEMLLGDAFEFEYGKALKKENRNGEGSYAVMGSNGIVGYHDEYLIKGPGIVVGRKGAAGEVTYIESDFWPIDTTYYVKPKKNISLKYGYYLLKSLRLNQFEKSTAIPGLNRNDAYSKGIFLPPIEQQNAIVSKIEELFSELDKGIEELKTAQQQLKVYRKAVLKWAFEGKLTNENVKEGELPEGWSWKTLEEIANVSGGLTKNSKREALPLKLPFLRVANVYFNEIELSELHMIGVTEKEIERVRLKKDDLLFVEGNGSVDQIGRVALWNGMVEGCVHQNHLIKARFNGDMISKYALYFYCSPEGRNAIKAQANSTSGLHTLSISKIAKLPIPICPSEVQSIVVQEIESRLSVCDKIEETILDGLKQADALRQSILKNAFECKIQ